MNILWLTWKDLEHPRSGGAETVNEELAKRLVRDGHAVTFIVGGFHGGAPDEMKNGYKIIRVGNRVTVYWYAYRYYHTHLPGWPDLVIDEVNTVPFFAAFYCKSKHPLLTKEGTAGRFPRTILFIHQLCRAIWFYELPFPLSLVGWLLEPLYLRLLNDQPVITVSASTKRDLLRYGFKDNNIHLIPEGIESHPLTTLPPKTFDLQPIRLLALGELRAMKRTDHIINAFEILKQNLKPLTTTLQPSAFNFKLTVAGSTEGAYAKKILRMVARSSFKDVITVLGRITDEQKLALLHTSHLLCVTSVKEGWGLVVTEAASQGTPAIVYDVDGLRDSVRHGETGIVCEENTPECMAENIMKLVSNPSEYERLRKNAWEWSREFTFERSYQEFIKSLSIANL